MPGLRLVDKWAVAIGGGANHRMGLYDMLMIKDNHIAAAGGITAAVHRAQVFLQTRVSSMLVIVASIEHQPYGCAALQPHVVASRLHRAHVPEHAS